MKSVIENSIKLRPLSLRLAFFHCIQEFNAQATMHVIPTKSQYVVNQREKKKKKAPWRFCSSHFDCLVRIWLAHHHEYALLAALCNIFVFFFPFWIFLTLSLSSYLSLSTQGEKTWNPLEKVGGIKGKTGFQRPKMKETNIVCNYRNMLKTFLMEGSKFR